MRTTGIWKPWNMKRGHRYAIIGRAARKEGVHTSPNPIDGNCVHRSSKCGVKFADEAAEWHIAFTSGNEKNTAPRKHHVTHGTISAECNKDGDDDTTCRETKNNVRKVSSKDLGRVERHVLGNDGKIRNVGQDVECGGETNTKRGSNRKIFGRVLELANAVV